MITPDSCYVDDQDVLYIITYINYTLIRTSFLSDSEYLEAVHLYR